MIISSENEAGKRLDGLGGIAAILRFKLNYWTKNLKTHNNKEINKKT